LQKFIVLTEKTIRLRDRNLNFASNARKTDTRKVVTQATGRRLCGKLQ